MAQIVWALVHEDEGPKGRVYGISFPDFPGAISGGRTIDEAIARGRETLAFHVEGMFEDGEPAPPLRSLEELRADKDISREMRDVKRVCLVEVPFELPGKPVRVNISIEDRLLDAVDRAAQARGQSRSAFLAEAAREKIKGAA
ncbi:MAG: type II toxin-antitoxin system HicB family antitoxin [Rhizomicrobium sp.]